MLLALTMLAHARPDPCPVPPNQVEVSATIDKEVLASLSATAAASIGAKLAKRIENATVVLGKDDFAMLWEEHSLCRAAQRANLLPEYFEQRTKRIAERKKDQETIEDLAAQLASLRTAMSAIGHFRLKQDNDNQEERLGPHDYCFLSGVVRNHEGYTSCMLSRDGTGVWWLKGGAGGAGNTCQASCVTVASE